MLLVALIVLGRTDPKAFGRRQGHKVKLADTSTDCEHSRGFVSLKAEAERIKKQLIARGGTTLFNSTIDDLFATEKQPTLGIKKYKPGQKRYSSHTCTGQVFMKEEWIGRSCFYRDLCFDTKSREFIYYRHPDEPDGNFEKEAAGASYFEPKNGPRGYMHSDKAVSLLPWNGFGGLTGADIAPPGGQAFKWEPKTVPGPIPDDAVMDSSSPIFILYYAYINFNIGHLMMDDFLPWFKLMRMFNVLSHDMQPLSFYPSENFTNDVLDGARKAGIVFNPMQIQQQCVGFEKLTNTTPIPKDCRDLYTKAMEKPAKSERELSERGFHLAQNAKECQNITTKDQMDPHFKGSAQRTLALWWYRKDMTRLCHKIQKKFGPAMTTRPTRLLDTHPAYAPPVGRTICFPRLVAGEGLLSEHCSDLHAHGTSSGQHADLATNNDQLLCNVAQGPQYYEFRNWMVSNLGLSDIERPCDASGELGILLGMRSSKGRIKGVVDTKYSPKSHEHWLQAAKQIEVKLGLKPHATVLEAMTLKEQVQLYAQSVVAVQQSGGASNTAVFLPKGGTLVLMAPVYAKNDYVLWGRMSHIHVEWIEMQDYNSLFDIAVLLKLVKHAVKRYHEYNDCYDSHSDEPPEHIRAHLDKLFPGVSF